ncbi:MAG TPA: hypothetical protein VN380_01960 [Thermoanaerobaculia bacterium]|jgi:hypothetical protein|nr:hypothetical protein [Thermoanaerobaculia bacterium]
MKRSTIAAISLMLLTAAAAVAEVSGERPVASPAYEAAPGYLSSVHAASDGHDFLVAWIDQSRNRSSNPNPKMYASRVSASGQVLDPLGIRIPTVTSAFSSYLSVVYLGNSYLVCWSQAGGNAGLMGVRISSDGTLLDPTPRVFANGGTALDGGIAGDGNRTVIVYNGPAGSLMLLVLDRDANIVDGPKALNASGPSTGTAMIASNGHGFLVLQTSGSVVRATTLDASGAIVTSNEPPLAPSQWGTLRSLASDGDSYVAILLYSAGGLNNFNSRHFGPNGELMEAWTIPDIFWVAGLAFRDGSYLVMELDRPNLGAYGGSLGLHRISSTGQPVGGYTPIVSGDHLAALTLASNGSSVFGCWIEQGRFDVLKGALIDAQSLTASSPSLIRIAATTQRTPDVAMSGANMAVVWNEQSGVYAGRLTFDGQLLDGRGIRIGGSSSTDPRIVFDGTNYIIGWTDWLDPTARYPNYPIKLARLSPVSGVLLDPGGITIMQQNQCIASFGRELALASGVHSILVAWSGCRNLVVITVNADLAPGALNTVATVGSYGYIGAIAAAWNGSEWLMVWENVGFAGIESFDPNPVEIDAARLSPQLTLLDSTPIDVSNSYTDSDPIVASDGNGFVVSWSHFDTPSGDYGVFARRIASDGSPQAPANGVRLGQGHAKSIVWDGLQYDLAFATVRDTSTLYVTHVAANGAIESLTPLAVVNDRSAPDASLLVTSPGRVTVAYTRIDSEPEYGDVERAFVRVPYLVRGRAVR